MQNTTQTGWPLWATVFAWFVGAVIVFNLLQSAGRTLSAPTPAAAPSAATAAAPTPAPRAVSEDAKHTAALLINLHGELCAKVTSITRTATANVYRVECVRYRDGTGSAVFEMNAATGAVK